MTAGFYRVELGESHKKLAHRWEGGLTICIFFSLKLALLLKCCLCECQFQ